MRVDQRHRRDPITIEGDVLPCGDLGAYVGCQPTTTTTWDIVFYDEYSTPYAILDRWCVLVGVSATNPTP